MITLLIKNGPDALGHCGHVTDAAMKMVHKYSGLRLLPAQILPDGQKDS